LPKFSIIEGIRRQNDARSRLEKLSDTELLGLTYDWSLWARDGQMLPDHCECHHGDWTTWLILAGRGFGKTRCGAEAVRQWIKEGFNHINFIAATADDLRDIMVEGESGIKAVCPPDERPIYRVSKRRLEWPNGAISLLFTAQEPDRLRGKQHEKLWCDEPAAWQYDQDSWDQAMFGLRLGKKPQTVATTTPRPTKMIRGLMADPTTHITRGTTYDNRSNLAPTFYSKIITKYEGTRLGRQELNAEILDDNPGALWKLSDIEATRVATLPEFTRIVVAIDPAVTSNKNSDETGIVVCAMDDREPNHFYVLEDASDIYTPDAWAKKAITLYHHWQADKVIGEVNNGGDMIEATLRHQDANVAYKSVRATRGKAVRAEPISAIYEQRRVHHHGTFGKLEDQLTVWNPATDKDSPDRLDALVWGITELAGIVEWSGLLSYYKHVAGEPEPDRDSNPKTPGFRPAPTVTTPVKAPALTAYNRAMAALAPKDLCDHCGKPLGDTVVEEGIRRMHPDCARPSWAS
jgi:phage terminase large subunit-like protein